jgi:hypothetical protein
MCAHTFFTFLLTFFLGAQKKRTTSLSMYGIIPSPPNAADGKYGTQQVLLAHSPDHTKCGTCGDDFFLLGRRACCVERKWAHSCTHWQCNQVYSRFTCANSSIFMCGSPHHSDLLSVALDVSVYGLKQQEPTITFHMVNVNAPNTSADAIVEHFLSTTPVSAFLGLDKTVTDVTAPYKFSEFIRRTGLFYEMVNDTALQNTRMDAALRQMLDCKIVLPSYDASVIFGPSFPPCITVEQLLNPATNLSTLYKPHDFRLVFGRNHSLHSPAALPFYARLPKEYQLESNTFRLAIVRAEEIDHAVPVQVYIAAPPTPVDDRPEQQVQEQEIVNLPPVPASAPEPVQKKQRKQRKVALLADARPKSDAAPTPAPAPEPVQKKQKQTRSATAAAPLPVSQESQGNYFRLPDVEAKDYGQWLHEDYRKWPRPKDDAARESWNQMERWFAYCHVYCLPRHRVNNKAPIVAEDTMTLNEREERYSLLFFIPGNRRCYDRVAAAFLEDGVYTARTAKFLSPLWAINPSNCGGYLRVYFKSHTLMVAAYCDAHAILSNSFGAVNKKGAPSVKRCYTVFADWLLYISHNHSNRIKKTRGEKASPPLENPPDKADFIDAGTDYKEYLAARKLDLKTFTNLSFVNLSPKHPSAEKLAAVAQLRANIAREKELELKLEQSAAAPPASATSIPIPPPALPVPDANFQLADFPFDPSKHLEGSSSSKCGDPILDGFGEDDVDFLDTLCEDINLNDL